MTKTTAKTLFAHLEKITLLICFYTLGLNSQAQQLVQTPKDLGLLCRDEEHFIGKPLKILFSELKPEITLVLAEEGGLERAPMLIFFFVTKSIYTNYRKQDKFPIRLRVYLKEPFTWWEGRKRGRENFMVWKKEDETKYEGLTVRAINVAGEYNECDYDSGQSL